MQKQLMLSVLLGSAAGAMAGQEPSVPALPRVYEIRLVSPTIPERDEVINLPATSKNEKPRFWSKSVPAPGSFHGLRAFARWKEKEVDLGDVEEFKGIDFPGPLPPPPPPGQPWPETHGGYGTEPRAMNHKGQVVGDMSILSGCVVSDAAFFYDGKMHNLQTLVPKDSDWKIYTATNINDQGEITGTGNKGVFLLVPHPAPAKPNSSR